MHANMTSACCRKWNIESSEGGKKETTEEEHEEGGKWSTKEDKMDGEMFYKKCF